MGLMKEADKGLAGFSITKQMLDIQPSGPLPYTSYDLLKHFGWVLGIVRLIAHVFSLPVIVWTRRRFGVRALDDIHIALAFLVWMAAGTVASGLGGLVSTGNAGPVAILLAVLLLPAAWLHRRAAIGRVRRREKVWSYYPGLPRTFWTMPVRWVAGLAGRVGLRLSSLEHWGDPVAQQHLIRRFLEPSLFIVAGLLLGERAGGPGGFLIVTGIMLTLDEALTHRMAWEIHLDDLDAEVIALERARIREGSSGQLLTGATEAAVARPPANDNREGDGQAQAGVSDG